MELLIEDSNIRINATSTGDIELYVNGVKSQLVYAGEDIIVENALGVGNNTVIAIYEGNENYAGSRNTTDASIEKLESFVSVTADEITYGSDAIIVVTVPDAQSGFVTILVDNNNYTAEIENGKATFTIPKLAVNEYPAVATYLGDANYGTVSNQTTLKVVKANLPADAVAQNITVLDDAAFAISVPDDFTGKVNITVDGVTYSGDANTLITLGKLSAGNKTAKVVFFDDNNYKDLTLDVPFRVSDVEVLPDILTIKADNMTRGWNSPYDYQAAFLDEMGNALVNAEVEFKVNGKTYTVKTNEDGIAQLTAAKLAVGTYNITSVNKATGQEVTTQLKIVKRLTGNKDLTMDYIDGSYFVVKVIGDNGKIAPVGEIVDIYINTVHYVAKVDKKGYAKLPINLIPKKYKVVAEYRTFKTTNKVVVKQTLKLVKKTVSIKKGKKLVLKAKLKWSSGKAIKGKTIKFKFRGKTYKAKTNKKGILK